MDQHEKQSSSTLAIQLWRLSCLLSFIAAHHRLIEVLIFGGITTPINIMEVRNESLPLGGNLFPRGNHNICRIIFRYRISSNNSRPSNNRSPPTPLSPSSLLFTPPCQVEVESDPAKLISDDSSSENQSRNQIWNT